MPRVPGKLVAVVVAVGVFAVGGAGIAAGQRDDGGGRDRRGTPARTFTATLTSYQEVPAVSSRATGSFAARLDAQRGRLFWRLTYRRLEARVLQAHIHFGQKDVNGGVSVFLCSNLQGAPPGTQQCPPAPATIRGTATAANVVGPAEQGIEPRAFGELVAAMRAGVTYANVHSEKFPNGETRGQIQARHERRR